MEFFCKEGLVKTLFHTDGFKPVFVGARLNSDVVARIYDQPVEDLIHMVHPSSIVRKLCLNKEVLQSQSLVLRNYVYVSVEDLHKVGLLSR